MKIDLISRARLSIINKNSLRYPLAEAEKDYFLAVVLKILYSSDLKDRLVFKGGTALNHLYLDQLRFSDDLDFGTLGEVTLEEIEVVFSNYDFLQIKKVSSSIHSLKIDRLKFSGPLGQPNSLKIDIDLTQEILLPVRRMNYRNVFQLPVRVRGMDLVEICAEKMRAVNERARYRDFYDLASVFKKKRVSPEKIISTLERKELRRPLSPERILENLNIAQEAKDRGLENLFYREEITGDEIEKALGRLLPLLD